MKRRLEKSKAVPYGALFLAALLSSQGALAQATAKSEPAKKAEVKVQTAPAKAEVKADTKAEVKKDVKAEGVPSGAGAAASAPAQPAVDLKDPIVERRELVAKFGAESGMVLGLFPGTVENADTFRYFERYLPMVNYLTPSAGQLVSFIPEPNVGAFKAKVENRRYPLVYVNAEIGAVAIQNGYEPIVKRTDPIVSVVMTKDDKAWSELKDLNGKKIGAVGQAMVTSLAKHTFFTNNVRPVIQSSGSSGQNEILTLLDSDLEDGVILREETAKGLISKNPDKKYKIAMKTGVAPGFILMANKDVSASVRDALRTSMLSVQKGKGAVYDRFLRGLDGQASGFEVAANKELEDMVNVFKASAEFDKQNANK